MNKLALIGAIALHSQLNKTEVGRALESLTKTIESALRNGHSVTLVGFGSFGVKERAERSGRNPQTGQDMTIAAARLPSFKAGTVLKAAVKG